MDSLICILDNIDTLTDQESGGGDNMLGLKSARLDPEATAIRALSFIAADPERLSQFLDASGIGPETLRSAASEPGFLAQVMDYLAGDEALLLAFAANEGLAPASVAAVHQALSRQHEAD